MKNLKLLAMILIIGIIAVSCKKETGPQGPAGPAGTNGTNGTNGNANVTVYGFPGVTYSSGVTAQTFTLPISDGRADSSLILPYYFSAGLWFPAGEVGLNFGYLTRYYLQYGGTFQTLAIKIMNVDATAYTGADQVWDSVKVIVIPANIFKSTPTGKIDFKNYQSVKTYYDVK